MTRDELRSAILKNLDDPGARFFTLDAVNAAIQDNYHFIVNDLRPFAKKTVITLPEARSAFDMSSVGDFLLPLSVWNPNGDFWLHRTSYEDLESCNEWERQQGSPTLYVIPDQRNIIFFPYRAQDLEFYYYYMPEDLAGSDIVDIDPISTEVLE